MNSNQLNEKLGAASTSTTSIEWAKSLIGRDWEIFWSETNDDEDVKAGGDLGKQSDNNHITPTRQENLIHSPHDMDVDQPSVVQDNSTSDNAVMAGDMNNYAETMLISDGNEGTTSGRVADQLAEHNSGNKKKDKEDGKEHQDDESVEDVEDWYYGHVISFVCRNGGTFVFKVSFVGDDDTLYDMELNPTIVRPSAQAWMKRSKAILEAATTSIVPSMSKNGDGKNDTNASFEEWESNLPADTSTIEDSDRLNEIRLRLEHSFPTTSCPLEMQQIKNLLYLVQAQIHLRQRLARIVSHGDQGRQNNEASRKNGNANGDLVPKEALVNHLLICLTQLEHACLCYCKCGTLHQSIFPNNATASVASSTSHHRRVTVTEFQEEYLKPARDSLSQLAAMDLDNLLSSPTGFKRRQSVANTNGTRRTKRRKKQRRYLMRDSDGEGDDGDNDSEELSLTNIDRLITKINSNEPSWYLLRHAEMVRKIAHDLWDPLLKWTQQADQMLGIDENGVSGNTIGQAMSIASSASSDGDDDSDASSVSDKVITFSYNDIESCLSLQSSTILKHFNLDSRCEKLRNKLEAIVSFEEDAMNCLRNLTSQEGDGPTSDFKSDPILSKLKGLVEAASLSPDLRPVANVDPLGRSLTRRLTREVLKDALVVRSWVLDIWHAQVVRERLEFIENVVSRGSDLPDLPPLSDEASRERARTHLESLQATAKKKLLDYASKAATCDKYEGAIINTQQSKDLSDSLCSVNGVSEALKELSSVPVLCEAEEMLAVRLDVLLWHERSQKQLRDDTEIPSFALVADLKGNLDAVLAGKSTSRRVLLRDIVPNEQVDAGIRSFAALDSALFCEQLVDEVNALYAPAAEWNFRADSIIKTLRAHGNPVVGTPQASSRKEPAMVDLNRVSDLVAEYANLGVALPDCALLLSNVLDAASKWSHDVQSIVENHQLSTRECLEQLMESRTNRPKGLLMDPARNVVDLCTDVLSWHQLVKKALDMLDAFAEKQLKVDELSDLIADCTFALLREGAEVIELFSERSDSNNKFKPSARSILDNLAQLQGNHRASRILSRSKLDGNQLGRATLNRLLDNQLDEIEGAPLRWMVFFAWYATVAVFVQRSSRGSSDQSRDESRPTMIQAKHLLSIQPNVPDNSLLRTVKSVDVAKLEDLICKGEQVEATIKAAIAGKKDLLRSSFIKQDDVRRELSALKELQGLLKSKSCTDLTISCTLEQQLDSLIKDVNWLVRTFPYPCLHTDDVDIQADWDHDQRVPLDVLVNLFDKIPPSATENLGDVARVALRVTDLHASALQWQEDVSRLTALSNRGAKRRAPGSSPMKAQNQILEAAELTSQVDASKVQKLAQHPILRMVAFPREDAVRSVCFNVTAFEAELHEFLGRDFDGAGSDMTRLPEVDSLVADDGEFILYRLTGSPLFASLKTSIGNLCQLALDAHADTPGKASFDWIQRAVQWIEDLCESVTPQQTQWGDRLAIPSAEARRVLAIGRSLFHDVPDDLRKTFSKHKVIITTNKQTGKMAVIVGKGGAPHSVGGTALRWCPLLLECLQADVSKLDQFETHAVNFCKEVAAFYDSQKGKDKPSSEESVYNLYKLRDEVCGLLDEGPELVVSPPEALIQNVSKMLSFIEEVLRTSSTTELNRKVAMKRYKDGPLLVRDRDGLLISLLSRVCFYRQYQETNAGETCDYSSLLEKQESKTFRENCRKHLQKALERGMKMMGIDLDGPKTAEGGLFSYCALKALEIEAVMFDLYQAELGDCQLSKEYQDKARSLRSNLANDKNPTLSSKVLLGVISASELVNMSPEQLASQKVQQDRARAAEEAARFKTLTPGSSAATTNEISPPGAKQRTAFSLSAFGHHSAQSEKQILTTPTATRLSTSVATDGFSKTSPPAGIFQHKPVDSAPIRDDKHHLPPSSARTTSDTPRIVALSPRVTRPVNSRIILPPPPPSLAAASLQPVVPNFIPSLKRIKGSFVFNADGGDRFTFKIPDVPASFSAGLLFDDDLHGDISGVIPEAPKNKGRLTAEEFTNFLSSKLNGGKWRAIALRLSTYSDLDAMEYKKFYKDYENNKKRISMFECGDVGTKLFLVTPYFHGAAKALTLVNRTSTYAVVLSRKN